ncbi:cupredoxin domain-containing protein [Mycobacterium sp. SMC-2]|uniref:cupredoxin domain-containing protein n=1 Tax=Mycobacterium sp. SMC-2 TaxID=2857058 RepID=UPI0021B37555|nr:cupredoxin domain-containing protein [Mycobacterium sp. SMC-2]UXA04299.1 cupredoxin domain-containing protein [Mycobacterium sp. SMC-2]
MTMRSTLAAAWVTALALALIACGGSPNQPPAAGPTIDVTVAKGQVIPTNAELHAKVRQQITVRVTSDAPDELHVHSTPDHKFAVAAAPNQTFQFSVDIPGNVEVELHHLDRTIATIQVQP